LSNNFNNLMALPGARLSTPSERACDAVAPEQKISVFQADPAGTFASRPRSAYGV
jgi:hypothetical protein